MLHLINTFVTKIPYFFLNSILFCYFFWNYFGYFSIRNKIFQVFFHCLKTFCAKFPEWVPYFFDSFWKILQSQFPVFFNFHFFFKIEDFQGHIFHIFKLIFSLLFGNNFPEWVPYFLWWIFHNSLLRGRRNPSGMNRL